MKATAISCTNNNKLLQLRHCKADDSGTFSNKLKIEIIDDTAIMAKYFSSVEQLCYIL